MTDTQLAKKLRLLIEANGPMTIADYMAHCLGDPAHGYYMTRDPFGAGGDFVTAPEVSQIFGEIVGAWLIETWRLVGSPSPVRLVELGPGRGTLMADILRVAMKIQDFRDAITIHLVEMSPALRARQAETLARWGAIITWHDAFRDVPHGPLLLVANEFVDALPIRQFVRTEGQWRERVVGLDDDCQLAFGLGPNVLEAATLVPPPSLATGEGDHAKHGGGGNHTRSDLHSPPPPRSAVPLPRFAGEEPGAIVEIRPAADVLMVEIADRIVAHGGAALIIDYGHLETALGETLQAVRGNAYADPLESPGEADLTAHVDFAALVTSARAAGAATHGPMTQGDFLLSLGLSERAATLGASADDATRETLRTAVDRLAGADQMGTLFRVLALTRPRIQPPPFSPKD